MKFWIETVYSSETFTSGIRELMNDGHDEGHNKFNPENQSSYVLVSVLLFERGIVTQPLE